MNISPQDRPCDYIILAECNIDSSDYLAFTEKIEDPSQYPTTESTVVFLLSPSKLLLLKLWYGEIKTQTMSAIEIVTT